MSRGNFKAMIGLGMIWFFIVRFTCGIVAGQAILLRMAGSQQPSAGHSFAEGMGNIGGSAVL